MFHHIHAVYAASSSDRFCCPLAKYVLQWLYVIGRAWYPSVAFVCVACMVLQAPLKTVLQMILPSVPSDLKIVCLNG